MRPALLIALLLTAAPAVAQRTLTGRVAADAVPVRFATVVLLRDGRQAAGTTTDSLGGFLLRIDTGRCTLQVHHVGFRPLEREVQAGSGDLDLGTLSMERTGIEAVRIEAHALRRQGDRFVIDVRDIPSLAGRDGADLLMQSPGVRLGDEGISINGASGTQVYVDGRKLRGDTEQIAAYLRSLDAAQIARIEVVPQAGAEFAADARGGVILITLRRQRDDGMQGSVRFAATQGDRLGSYAPSGRIGVHAGRWTLDASAAGSFSPQAGSRFTETREYAAQHAPFAGTSDAAGRSGYGRGTLSLLCDPSPSHAFGISAEYAARSMHLPTEALTVAGHEASMSRYGQHIAGGTFTAAVNYRWKIDTLGSHLLLAADYTRHAADGDNDYATRFTTPGAQRDTLSRSAVRSRYDLLTADLSLVRKFRRGPTLRSGLRYTLTGNDARSGYEARQGEWWEPLPDYGNAQRFTEHIAAAYASLALTAGRWEFSGGLRGEYVRVVSSALGREYRGLFPHLSISHALNPLRTWMLVAQWSRNIERPAFAALDPAHVRLSEYSYQTGNPALRPTYIHRWSLTAVWRYRYTLTVGANLHRDLIREVADIDPTTPDLVCIRPENHHMEDHWFAALAAPVQITSWWRLSLNAVGVIQRIRLARGDAPSAHGLLFADATAAFTLPAGFYIEAVFRAQSRLYSGNSEVGPRRTFDATIKKQLFRKRLTLYLTGQNLTESGMEYVSATDGMRRVLRGRQAAQGRTWQVGATWNFRSGHAFKARKIESASADERKRIAPEGAQSK